MTEGKKIGVIVGALVLLLVSIGKCSVSKHENSLGTPMYMDNPFTYKAGAITTASYVAEGKGIAVRIQPIGTYGLFTEDILFCGEPVAMFQNKTNPMVLTYRTKASRTIEGVGCHELIRVDSMMKENMQ
jgi:hypothetical protein